MDYVVMVDGLCKSYGDKIVVNDLNLGVKKQSVYGLLGANGAGKSTTIECILGTKKKDRGSVSILGMDPIKHRRKLYEKVGVQFQEANYQENIRVVELCEVTASLYKECDDYMTLLREFGLLEKKDALVKELSGGQKQRLFIILALIPKPEVVFLDELTTGLDARARRDVWKILTRLKEKGLTIFLTSHYMDEVEHLCDEICILKQGKSVFFGTCKEAIDKSPYETLEEAYLWFTEEEEYESV